MRQSPLSANTMAPASNRHSPVWLSCFTVAVRPTADAPLPVAYTQRGAIFCKLFKNWDLAIPGSPSRSTLISPLTLCPFYTIFF